MYLDNGMNIYIYVYIYLKRYMYIYRMNDIPATGLRMAENCRLQHERSSHNLCEVCGHSHQMMQRRLVAQRATQHLESVRGTARDRQMVEDGCACCTSLSVVVACMEA